ncbi:MAG: hypothetical protein EOO75_00730, partial [Myxococcales bacterium]
MPAALGRLPPALEQARELAEVTGQRQSAAIASGQLGVLALDGGRPALAVRHLGLQLGTAGRRRAPAPRAGRGDRAAAV